MTGLKICNRGMASSSLLPVFCPLEEADWARAMPELVLLLVQPFPVCRSDAIVAVYTFAGSCS